MDNNYTHITMVVDRSGSMASIQSDAEGAINQFITDQKKVDGKATLTLIDFDAPQRGIVNTTWQWPTQPWLNQPFIISEDHFKIVYDGDLSEAQHYSLVPRGGTALYDAIGKAMSLTGTKLRNMLEKDRPGKVVFIVQTDGEENSSIEYNFDKVSKTIAHQQDVYKWEIVFLGAGLNSAAQGYALGIRNVTQYAPTGASYAASVANLSYTTDSYRKGNVGGMSATNVVIDEEGEIKSTTS